MCCWRLEIGGAVTDPKNPRTSSESRSQPLATIVHKIQCGALRAGRVGILLWLWSSWCTSRVGGHGSAGACGAMGEVRGHCFRPVTPATLTYGVTLLQHAATRHFLCCPGAFGNSYRHGEQLRQCLRVGACG